MKKKDSFEFDLKEIKEREEAKKRTNINYGNYGMHGMYGQYQYPVYQYQVPIYGITPGYPYPSSFTGYVPKASVKPATSIYTLPRKFSNGRIAIWFSKVLNDLIEIRTAMTQSSELFDTSDLRSNVLDLIAMESEEWKRENVEDLSMLLKFMISLECHNNSLDLSVMRIKFHGTEIMTYGNIIPSNMIMSSDLTFDAINFVNLLLSSCEPVDGPYWGKNKAAIAMNKARENIASRILDILVMNSSFSSSPNILSVDFVVGFDKDYSKDNFNIRWEKINSMSTADE